MNFLSIIRKGSIAAEAVVEVKLTRDSDLRHLVVVLIPALMRRLRQPAVPMTIIESIHQNWIFPRRVRVLSGWLASLLPSGSTVLDVGCGDGNISRSIMTDRPDLEIKGLEVLLRPEAKISVSVFDGRELPVPDKSFDVVMFVDVLHHATDAVQLLREAHRVARQFVVIKDHTADGFLSFRTLRFLDDVGNARHGVALPYKYWARSEWASNLAEGGMTATTWERKLKLYPWPASLLFDRSLHFVAKLVPAG